MESISVYTPRFIHGDSSIVAPRCWLCLTQDQLPHTLYHESLYVHGNSFRHRGGDVLRRGGFCLRATS